MPGEVSRTNPGPGPRSPYVPHWCFPNNAPKICPCGHHEGYHGGDNDLCLLVAECGCGGLPDECKTTDEEMFG